MFRIFNGIMQTNLLKDKLTEENFKSLKILLKKMHLLKLIHFDLKPSNIVFSNQLKKYVFIDFGVSELINQDFGQKSLTNFRGTIQFCGEQLKKCFLQRKSKYVDLYFNDVECLKKTFISLKIQKDQKNTSHNLEVKNQIAQIQNQLKLILIKFYLIRKEIQKASSILVSIKNNSKKMFAQIYTWLAFLPNLIDYEIFGKRYLKYQQNQLQYKQQQCQKELPLPYYYNQNLFLINNFKKQSETSNQIYFQSFYKKIQNSSNFSVFFQSKIQAKQILKARNFQFTQKTYFLILVQYLSFCKNIFKTDLEQKYQISKIYLQSLNKNLNIPQQKQCFTISEQIESQKLKTIIKCVNFCLYLAQNNIQDSIFRSIYMDLLQQSIFLKCKTQSSDKIYYKIMKNQTKLIKKLQFFIKYYYGLKHQINKINISKQLFNFHQKTRKDFLQANQLTKLKQLKIQIQEIFSKDASLTQNQKQFYISFLETIIKFLQYLRTQQWQYNQLYKYYNLIWKFIQKYKQNIYGGIFQNSLQIIILLIFHNQFKIKFNLDTYIRKEFYQEYVFYNLKNSNIITKIDFSMIFLYTELRNFNKLKQSLKSFDQKINCLQIQDLYFTAQKMFLAFVFNGQSHILSQCLNKIKNFKLNKILS